MIGCHGAFVVYTIADKNSFKDVTSWVAELQQIAPQCTKLILVGNKADLEETREVTAEEGMDLATGLNMLFIETSAKKAHNVQAAFTNLARELYIDRMKSTIKPISKIYAIYRDRYGICTG